MKLARTVRLDESDDNVFERPADAGEWAISGGFEFSDWDEKNLTGKPRQAFSNGWLSLDSFGRATFVAVASITETEYQSLIEKLAQHFVDHYGAPNLKPLYLSLRMKSTTCKACAKITTTTHS